MLCYCWSVLWKILQHHDLGVWHRVITKLRSSRPESGTNLIGLGNQEVSRLGNVEVNTTQSLRLNGCLLLICATEKVFGFGMEWTWVIFVLFPICLKLIYENILDGTANSSRSQTESRKSQNNFCIQRVMPARIFISFKWTSFQTRMHSSRMLSIPCSGRLMGGVSAQGRGFAWGVTGLGDVHLPHPLWTEFLTHATLPFHNFVCGQ